MTKWRAIVVLILVQFSYTFAKKELKCDDSITETNNGIAYWKFRGTRYTTSEDVLCWKDDWEIFLRECNSKTGEWLPEHVVCKAEQRKNMYCPEDLLEIYDEDGDTLCIKVSSKPQKYNDTYCHGANIVLPKDLSKDQFVNFKKVLLETNISEYWLPIRRENIYTPFTTRLPGKQWGVVIDDNTSIRDFVSEKNCMSAIISHPAEIKTNFTLNSDSLDLKITGCAELLPAICVFKGDLITKAGCPQGERALSYRPHECFGVGWKNLSNNLETQIRINQYFPNRNTYRFVLKSLAKNEEYDFFQVGNFTDKLEHEYLIIMNRKEVVRVIRRESDTKFPILYKNIVTIPTSPVQLILKFDDTLRELLLIIYNGDYLWRMDEDDVGVVCFTNADYDLLRITKIDLIWKNKNKTKMIFKVKLLGDGPGEYWCEGHTAYNFSFVATPRIVAVKKRRGHAFAANLNITCIVSNKNLCYNFYKNAKKLAKHVLETLQGKKEEIAPDLVIHNTRIMSIQNIAFQTLDCWVHFTVSLKDSAVDNSNEENSEEDNSSETVYHIKYDVSVRMNVWNLLKKLIAICSPYGSNIIRSTEYCFPDIFRSDNGEIYQWNQAVIGQMGILSHLCIQSNGMPYTRQCTGDFIQGAYWSITNEGLICQNNESALKATKTLYSLTSSKMLKTSPEKVVKEVKHILQENSKKAIPVDIYFTADIVQASIRNLEKYIMSLSQTTSITDHRRAHAVFKETISNLIHIYNSLIKVKETTLRMSAKLNSTNKFLDVFENAMNNFPSQSIHSGIDVMTDSAESEPDSDFEVLDYEDIGVSLKISPSLLYFIINPFVANVSGIAMFKNDNSTGYYPLKGAFKNEHYRFLQTSHEIDELIYEPNLQFATFVPENLLLQLDTILNSTNITENSNTIVVIKVYSNDKLFQSGPAEITRTAFGRVVSISLPGHSSHLPEDLPIIFRTWQKDTLQNSVSTDQCSYWNFENWASDGIQSTRLSEANNQIVLCQVSHLTPFAYLVGFNFTVEEGDEVNIRPTHALDIITVTGCTLSLLGISGIFITATIFSSWRQKPSSKVLLQLSAAIALQMIIFCFINTEEFSLHLIINKVVPSCVAIGALLHYSVLVQFFWMILIAYLQFKRYVKVIGGARPNRFFMKATIFCWGLPLLPVVLAIVLDHDSYSKGPICYPSGYALYLGIILPITIIIVANFIIFCLIIYNILVSSTLPIRHNDKPILIYQIRLSVLLFFLLGFTWCFGILSSINAGIVFSYLFSLTATLQGFVIFMYFIILDPVTRNMWRKFFCKLCSSENTFLSTTTSDKDITQSF